jgi:3-oxoacyl-[acyl-carrier-protein] synthase-3
MAEGPQVYFTAVEGMLRTAQMLLAAEGLGFSDIDYVVPHQPNRRIIDRLAKLAGIPFSKFVVNIERYGNMSGASAAVAFDEVINTLRPKEGARILVVTAGAGYTAGAALVVV